jgi:uncharacterized protein
VIYLQFDHRLSSPNHKEFAMTRAIWLLLLSIGIFTSSTYGDDAKKKRLLLVTDSGGFVHDSVGVAEEVLKEIGPKYGVETTCYRYTRDPDSKEFVKYAENFRKRTGVTVEKENCGRVNAETLKKFDAVLFFTTGNPLNEQEVKDLVAWVKGGGAIAGTHCGSDTLYPSKERPWNQAYGELMGAYFWNHPWHTKIKVIVEDPHHPAAAGFETGSEITDEIYQFRNDVYSRNKLHIIMKVDNSSIKIPTKDIREDKDFAIAWCQEIEKGKSFYTSLGHRKEVWKDPRFQEHLMGGLQWAMGLKKGDATPSNSILKKSDK